MPTGPGLAESPSQSQLRPRWSKNVTAVFLLAVIATAMVALRKPLANYALCWDFDEFYIAAQMVRHGGVDRFYDFAAQAEFQTKYVGTPGIAGMPDNPFLYPAATALPYLPLAWLPLKTAYATWMAVNMALLLVSVRLLQRELAIPQGNAPLMLALMAAPVFIGLVGGQVIFLLLLLYVLAFRTMRRQQWFAAGVLIGLVGLKFQLMLGVAVILFARAVLSSLRDSRDKSALDYWRAIGGIAVGGVIVAVLSAVVVGWRQVLAYPAIVRAATYHRHVAYPTLMVNIRGLLALITGQEPRVWVVAAISIAVIGAAICAWKDLEMGFALAIVASVLTAFHEYPQEMALLLVPLAIAAERVEWDRRKAVAMFVLVSAVTFGLFSVHAQPLMGISCAAMLVGMLGAKSVVGNPKSVIGNS